MHLLFTIPRTFFSQHFKVVVSVLNRISKFENVKSMDATTERCSEKKCFAFFLKTKVNYLTSTKKFLKTTCKGVNFW